VLLGRTGSNGILAGHAADSLIEPGTVIEQHVLARTA
jgi:hypothetical protein